jgi:hypothetical protein
MANKFLNGINVTGTTTLNTVANAGTDTDKFLVLDASGNVDFRTGDELYADLGIGSLPAGFTSTVKHAVKAGVALTKGQAVYVTGADGTNMIVGKASNASEATSSKTMGLIETTLSINGIGNVITEGLLTGLDTTGAAAAGDPVWLGTDGNLIYGLTNKPYAPAHLVFMGIVTRRNANNGEIFVKVQNGFELNEIHDVDLKTTAPINGHILGYNGTLWVNKTIAGWLGFTPADDSLVVKLAGAQTITGAKSFDSPITVNSGIGFLNGVMPPITSSYYSGIGGNSEGISIVTRPVSTNYTNNLYFATSNNSFTFPDATGTIALTSNLSAYVPTSRTLTINGVTYDLTANRSWTIEAGGTSASTRTIQKFTSTSNQTTFTITGGYTVGMVDVWVNGSKLDNAVDFTASNGTTVVLTDALTANQIVEVYKYGSQFIVNNGLRQKTLFTATAGQTSFTVAYSVGLVDVFYNGSKLDDSEFTATNGTSIVLGTACAVNDKVEVIAFSYNVNGFTGIGGSGTTNNLPKFTAAGTIGDSAITDNGTTVTLVSRALSGTSATFSGAMVVGGSSTAQQFSVFGANDPRAEVVSTANNSAGTYFRVMNGATMTGNATMRVTNTGLFELYTGGASDALRLSIASTGSLGIGTTPPTTSNFPHLFSGRNFVTFSGSSNDVYIGSNFYYNGGFLARYSEPSIMINSSNGDIIFGNSSSGTAGGALSVTEKMRITSGGNVGIGTSSPQSLLQVGNFTNNSILTLAADASSVSSIYFGDGTGAALYRGFVEYAHETDTMRIGTSSTERMRITSGGYLKATSTGSYYSSTGTYHEFIANGTSSNTILFRHTGSDPYGLDIAYPSSSPNGGANNFIYCVDSTAQRASIRSNGGLANYQSNNVNLSDIRTKKDITSLESYWNKFKAIEIVKFKYIDQTHDDFNIGVIAQQVEAVAPEFIDVDGWGETPEDGIPLKSIYTADLYHATIKVLQEAMARIEEQQAQIEAQQQTINSLINR